MECVGFVVESEDSTWIPTKVQKFSKSYINFLRQLSTKNIPRKFSEHFHTSKRKGKQSFLTLINQNGAPGVTGGADGSMGSLSFGLSITVFFAGFHEISGISPEFPGIP